MYKSKVKECITMHQRNQEDFDRSVLLGSNIMLGSEQLLLGFIRIGRFTDSICCMTVSFMQLLFLWFELYHLKSVHSVSIGIS